MYTTRALPMGANYFSRFFEVLLTIARTSSPNLSIFALPMPGIRASAAVSDGNFSAIATRVASVKTQNAGTF